MATVVTKNSAIAWRLVTWGPLACLPAVTVWIAAELPPWVFMWGLALAIYAGLKWLSFVDACDSPAPAGLSLGYLLLWPGMDARAFLSDARNVGRPRLGEWVWAGMKCFLGVTLFVVASRFVNREPTVAAWTGMAGIVFALHFGLFHLLSVTWRRAGVDARPIMDVPMLSSSLSEFWGARWNLAFRDLAHIWVFRPLVGRVGIAGATVGVFLVSGLVHDAVISIPAGAGFGLPTLYFFTQGAGVLFERSRLGKRLGTRRSVLGRGFCAAVVLGPVSLLFHQPFVERVIVPMLTDVSKLWS